MAWIPLCVGVIVWSLYGCTVVEDAPTDKLSGMSDMATTSSDPDALIRIHIDAASIIDAESGDVADGQRRQDAAMDTGTDESSLDATVSMDTALQELDSAVGDLGQSSMSDLPRTAHDAQMRCS